MDGAARAAGRARPRAVLRSYFAISGVYTLSASLIWGVNTLFLLDAGLDVLGVFVAGAAFTAGSVLFEIPTGVVADTVGRRASFLASVSLLCVGTLVYVAIPQAAWDPLLPFAIASVFLGLGFSFYSGAVEAWLVDALHASGFDGELDGVFSRGAMVSGAAMLIGTVGGGLLGQLDLRLPFLARSALLALVLVLALHGMRDLGFSARPLTLATLRREMASVARAGVRYGWNERSLRWLMLASAAQSVATIWGFYAWQPYFQQLLDTRAVWFAGVVAAGMAASTMIGNSVVDLFARACGRRTTLLLWAGGFQALATIGVGLAPGFPGALGLLLAASAAAGVIGPVRQAYIHKTVAGEHRATVVSFDSMVGSLGGVGGQAGLGWLARLRDYPAGYVAGGAIATLAVPLFLAIRRSSEDADRIVGEAGTRSACAAQGLAGAGAVDDKPYGARPGYRGGKRGEA
jgi:MFS family permease